jgi:formylglycine-generating enzyme required for sulfatase activity
MVSMRFTCETGRQPQTHFWQDAQFNQPLQPVFDIRWHEAMQFCQWLSDKIGYQVMLPTDAQWQRAAQGDDDRKYPWGNDWDSNRCNTEQSHIGHTTPVTEYPQGASPYGVLDMIGNVFEWCLTDAKTGKNSLNSEIPETHLMDEERIFKGGCFNTSSYSANVITFGATPIFYTYATGFRLATSNAAV